MLGIALKRRVSLLVRQFSAPSFPRLQQQVSASEVRAARRAKVDSLRKTHAKSPVALIGGGIATFGFAYASYDIYSNPNGTLGKMYYGSWLDKFIKSCYESAIGDVFLPASDKLLPDWGDPSIYGLIPPGQPAPPLLVVDLERTLIASEHDGTHGWRHVKRPGLDKFIKDLSNYYEIVLFSENDAGVAMDIFLAIDPDGRCHKFGSSHAEMQGSNVLKRLDLMNRDLSRIILIDDNPESAKLFPRNTLYVKPFTDVNDTHDTILLDLVPLLQGLVHENISDYPRLFDDLGTHDAEEVVTEYRMRLAKRKAEEQAKRNKGLGAIIRGSNQNTQETDDGYIRSSILSARDIVGGSPSGAVGNKVDANPTRASDTIKALTNPTKAKEAEKPALKKKGKLFSSLDDWEKVSEEKEMRKRELMNQIAGERMEKKMKEQQERSKQSIE